MVIKSYLPLLLAGLGLAASPPMQAETSDPNLAAASIQALLHYCTGAVPKNAAQYKFFMTALVSSGDDAKKLSAGYQSAYEAMLDQLGKIPSNQAPQACAAMTGVNG